MSLYRQAAWLAKMPRREWLRKTIERRIPMVHGRSWRSGLSSRAHVNLINGKIKYTYRGIRMVTSPFEIALYMKLLWELKPRSVIEIGTREGGTACWLGDMMAVFGLPGLVISIDVEPPARPACAKASIRFLKGDEGNLSPLQVLFEDLPHPWLVLQDASHSAPTMLRCLNYLHGFTEKGDYLVVESACLTEAGLDWDGERKGGPGLAIAKFFEAHQGLYEIDANYCDFYGPNVTGNPNGYLRRL